MNTTEKEFLTYIGVIAPEKEAAKPEAPPSSVDKSYLYISQGTINQCIVARNGWYNPCPVVAEICKTFNTHRHIIISNKCIRILDKKYKITPELEAFTTAWHYKKEVKPFSLELIPLENA